MVMKDGQQVAAQIVDVEELGTSCGIRIPKQFEGWVSIPLDVSNLKVANGYQTVMTAFTDATTVAIENRRVKANMPIEDYYIIDELTLSNNILGQVKSTEDDVNYGEFDTSVKGSASIKNIIFMIGDGMGDGSLAAARLNRKNLNLDSIQRYGYIVTNNVYNQTTDSAAAGTALATGHKTSNKTVGLLDDGTPVMNLSEWMKQFGKKIGIVSSSYLNDATPACFASHTSDRGNNASITKDFVDLEVDLLLGGGAKYFNSTITLDDKTTISGIEYAKTVGGYQYVTTKAELENADGEKLLGLFTESGYMNYLPARPSTEPNLADLTTKALSFLENDDEGFFVMIEGGNIDHANHANQSQNTITETLEFDDAVKVAKEYVDSHKDTLLVITADHETGGVKVVNGEVTYSSTNHTAELIPYYVYGAETEHFVGLTDNTQIPKAIMAATVAGNKTGATSILEGETYTATDELETIEVADSKAKYAMIKYRNSEAGLYGKLDDTLVRYESDGEWHISEVIELGENTPHLFEPLSCIKLGGLSSIEIEGASVEIAYVAFFDSFEAAMAAQTAAALKDEMPQVMSKEPEQKPEPENPTLESETPSSNTGGDITNEQKPSIAPLTGDMGYEEAWIGVLVVTIAGIVCIRKKKEGKQCL